MLTIKEVLDGVSGIDEMGLLKISGKLWEIGRLEEIKETVSSDLFLSPCWYKYDRELERGRLVVLNM